MKKFVTYILILLPSIAFGQLLPQIGSFKGDILEVTETKYGKEIFTSKQDSGVFMPRMFSGWAYFYQFDRNHKLSKRTILVNGKINSDYLYHREQKENRKYEWEIIKDNPEDQIGDYVEYENFYNVHGQIEKVNHWSFDAKNNNKELFLVETDAEYEGDKLLAFTRYNVNGNGDLGSGEKCVLFYDNFNRLIRIERKYSELNIKTIIYYYYNSKGLIDRYSIDFLVGLRNDQDKKKQEIFFKYDRHGNWRKKYLIDGREKRLEAKRRIKYN